jgi:hypothetical protein
MAEKKDDVRRSLTAALAGLLWLPVGAQPAAKAEAFRTMTWEDLVPKGWDPMKSYREKNIAGLREGDPREAALMTELRAEWDKAPTRHELSGARVKLPGYVVPLETASGGGVSEFLLVPYFGACVHSPPPPANQIVHVVLAKPQALRTMDVVWVSGTLKTQRIDSMFGTSGYGLQGSAVEPYQPPTISR